MAMGSQAGAAWDAGRSQAELDLAKMEIEHAEQSLRLRATCRT